MEGANDRVQLAALGAELNRRTVEAWMRAGVTVVDPSTTWIDSSVTLDEDVRLLPNTQLHGTTSVARDAVVGPDTTLTDVEVGEGATVIRTHGSGSVIGPRAAVTPPEAPPSARNGPNGIPIFRPARPCFASRYTAGTSALTIPAMRATGTTFPSMTPRSSASFTSPIPIPAG